MENKEKYIIDQIHNHRETVDTDDLWSNLAGSIPRKESKRRAIIWFCSGLVFFSLISLFCYLVIDKREGFTISNELQNNEIAEEKTAAPTVNLNQNEDSNNIVKDELEKEVKQNYETQVNRIFAAKKELKGTNVREENRGFSSKNSAQAMAANEFLQIVENRENEIAEQSRSNVHSLIREENVADKTGGILFDVKQGVDTKVTFGRNENVLYLAPLDFNKLNYKADLGINRTSFSSVDLLTEQSMKVNKWSMFVNTGVSFITRNLTTSESEFIDQRNRREQIENVRGGLDVSVGLSYSFAPSLSISSGLIFGQIYEQSTYSTSYLIESEGVEITSITYKQDGSVSSVTENVKLYTNRETNEVRNNVLRYYSIPVMLQYRLIENDKYRLSLNGTVAYSFSQEYSGFTSLDFNQPAYSLEFDAGNNFCRSGSVSYGLGLEISRRISHNWELNIGVGARRMQGVSSITNPIDQKYKLYTFTFGMSRKI